MLGAEFSSGLFSIETHFFLPQTGLITKNLFFGDWNQNVSHFNGGFGVGIVPKFYTNRAKGGFYVGPFLGLWQAEPTFTDGSFTRFKGLSFGANVGHKFVFSSGLYLRTGGYLGSCISTQRDWYSDPSKGSQVHEDWSGLWDLFGFFDIAIGFNLKK